ncbi:hypothetical protein GLOTRDRAFT_98692 [Gloeophyllum trabeum ATCC 11539]|uniref:Nascent polypeptide-associated complex subunit alpha-like UBA domain-containing protein n=1 Tax=Gloeophyllum trabeum (strain ATCC 11539 / FP-39264 / Madison 617) TaxID=670483 RepID=S7RWZ6_GLOTA|nr:uncharacterized protein GLOTRDRAFT_98692 [Gloeophyllum trabeum ATCC 11539]EPQ57874.1 hypothetical protein GLOTRDRAFT_98692 [Gloeophyllum trabeum ATCC 11539]
MSIGRPEPEVIVNYADGYAYSKGKMEEAFRSGLFEKPASKSKDTAKVVHKKEDVDLIVNEFEITKAQAEKALVENGGDLAKTLKALVTP